MNSQQQPQAQTQQTPASTPPSQSSPDPTPDSAPAKLTLQGTSHDVTDVQALHEAIEQAFDYRGDVTIHTADGRIVEGYIFDRRIAGSESHVRIIPAGTTQRVTIQYHEITRLEFTGRDTAAGKSWETWIKKYEEKKARGEAADLHPDPLDESQAKD